MNFVENLFFGIYYFFLTTSQIWDLHDQMQDNEAHSIELHGIKGATAASTVLLWTDGGGASAESNVSTWRHPQF